MNTNLTEEALLTHTRPAPRIIERLTSQIRSHDCAPGAWIAGGEALAIGLLAAAGEGELDPWASDLADTMVGALLRVLDRSVNTATVEERVRLARAAAVLSVARPHCTSVLDGAVDAWLEWTPEPAEAHHGGEILGAWTMLCLLRANLDGAAHAAWRLSQVDDGGPGMILHDWAVARIQVHGQSREIGCFHALRTSLSARDDNQPALLVLAAAVAVQAGKGRRRTVRPWLEDIAKELARDGTARATPLAVGRR